MPRNDGPEVRRSIRARVGESVQDCVRVAVLGLLRSFCRIVGGVGIMAEEDDEDDGEEGGGAFARQEGPDAMASRRRRVPGGAAR